MFLGARQVHADGFSPYAQNASDCPVCDAEIWHANPDSLSGPDDLGVIMPDALATSTQDFPAADALTCTVLTFRDAEGICWIRWPDGIRTERTYPTAREAIVAGKPAPQPPARA